MTIPAISGWSAIQPFDYFIWFPEVAPVIIGVVVLGYSYVRFPLILLTYRLILLHMIILMIRGYYTYAEVPLFNWLSEEYELGRNHYDKIGHFFQGFVPAIIAREILIRKSILHDGRWLFFVVTCICLAISAFYELIEWWVAPASDTAADAFLGTRGYVWDTQSDMALVLLGAVLALLGLRRMHDRRPALLHV